MKRMITASVALLSALSLVAQDWSSVLSSVEGNNTTLKALRAETEAIKAEARTGLTPADPEVELGYLWGTPKDQGNRLDLNVTQTFDFPTVYHYRKMISRGEATVADFEYATQRKAILLEAEKTCIDIVYHNALANALKRRLDSAQAIADASQKSADKGDISALDLRKAVLNLVAARKDYEANEVTLKGLEDELTRLNGGKEIKVKDDSFSGSILPEDFEEWYTHAESVNPELQAISAQSRNAENQVRLAQAEWLPKFSVGYVSERIAGTSLQGIGAGISIPLWEGKGKVKAAKARSEALKARCEDSAAQFHNTLRNKYHQAVGLQKVASDYKAEVSRIVSLELLDKALASGEISLVEYELEEVMWYDALSGALESERDYLMIVAELNQYSR